MRHLPSRVSSSSPRWFGRSLSALALLTGSLLSAGAQTTALSPAAQKQMAEIDAFKKSFTPAEKKMSFNLVLLSRQAHHQPLGSLARFASKSAIDGTGKILIDLQADPSPSLVNNRVLTTARAVDGDLPQSAFTTHRLRTHVAPADLTSLADSSDVRSLREASRAFTNVGKITSQGYVAHAANKAVALGVTGRGISVGVLSDSASAARVAALIASGDLPPNVTVLPKQSGETIPGVEDEGAAMMEIIHDLAPGANLFFATAYGGQNSFAENIRTLRFTYHCDIIVDDVSYFDEGVFQDGPIAQAVNDIVADGGLYFSSSANSGNLTSGTSGTWEGDFKNGGVPEALVNEGLTSRIHLFGSRPYDTLTSIGSGVVLKWSDPLGASSNDYDLYILDATGKTIKGVSAAPQEGSEDPYEAIYEDDSCTTAAPTGYCGAPGDQIVVIQYLGAARALHIDTLRGTLSLGTSGSTYGHNAARSTFTMAATYWNSARRGVTPFTGAANPIEPFSSDGPRKIFYNPDGSPITPGRFLFSNHGGITLQKPEATAADGVNTATPGFAPFFGTSAAAPHAAAIAALVKSVNPALTNIQIRKVLLSTALDNMAPGVDRDGGFGVLAALPAVQAVTPAAK